MKVIFLGWIVFAFAGAYGQMADDPALAGGRIRAICEYVTKDVLQPRGIKGKPNLWPLYTEIDYSMGPFLYDSIRKSIPHLPKYVHREDGGSKKIPFMDSSVAHIFDDYKKVGPGMTIYLAPPDGRFFVGELREAHGIHQGGYVMAFEFEGDKIIRSYIREWFN